MRSKTTNINIMRNIDFNAQIHYRKMRLYEMSLKSHNLFSLLMQAIFHKAIPIINRPSWAGNRLWMKVNQKLTFSRWTEGGSLRLQATTCIQLVFPMKKQYIKQYGLKPENSQMLNSAVSITRGAALILQLPCLISLLISLIGH